MTEDHHGSHRALFWSPSDDLRTLRSSINYVKKVRETVASGTVTIAVIGDPGCGKSKLLGSLLHEHPELLPLSLEQYLGQTESPQYTSFESALFDGPTVNDSCAWNFMSHSGQNRPADTPASPTAWTTGCGSEFDLRSGYTETSTDTLSMVRLPGFDKQYMTVGPILPRLALGHGLPNPTVHLTFHEDLIPASRMKELRRFIDGVLAALCFMLAIVLAALSRRPDALALLLLIISACLHYGRREDPDDFAPCPIRRCQT